MGNPDAYLEYEKKTKNYTKEKWVEVNDGLMAVFAGLQFASRVVQASILTKHRRL